MPSTSSLVGHQDQIQSLLLDLEAGNVAHAYLFTGRKHLGKFTVAKWFAKTLLTEGVPGEGRARAEYEVDKLLHRDLMVIDRLWIEEVCEDFDAIAKSSNVPQAHRSKKPTAKTDTIGIDDIRAVQERLREVGAGTYRCCLVRSAERLQEEAVNALLKILEEPPEGAVFLLTAGSTSHLLPTLVSRSRVLRFSSLAPQEMKPLVAGMPPDDAQFLLRVAQGAPGMVLRLKANPDFLRQERQRAAWAQNFWGAGSPAGRLKLLEPLADRGEEASRSLLHLSLALREERERMDPQRAEALTELAGDLQTNASRPLVLQKFVFAVRP